MAIAVKLQEASGELEQFRRDRQLWLVRLFELHENTLRRIIAFRLDRRLWRRVDVDDLLQETFLAASRRAEGYLRQPTVPQFIWLRQITLQLLIDTHRHHLGVKKRSACMEIPLLDLEQDKAASISHAARLSDHGLSSNSEILHKEALARLRRAFQSIRDHDREVLTLRHFEQLGNNEVARFLGIQKAAASNRYVRALARLRSAYCKLSARDDPIDIIGRDGDF